MKTIKEQPQEKEENIISLSAIITTILAIGLGLWLFGGGFDNSVKNNIQDLNDNIAQDVVDQYNIASKSGDDMEICVRAGIVAAAYLQAEDEKNYLIWKDREDLDCQRAGL